MGHRSAQGYGKIGHGRGCVSAHRVAYAAANGLDLEELKGLDVCHRCDNPPCCEPTHLFAGTEKDNIADMMRKGRWGGAVGSRSHFAKLTEEKVREMRLARMWGGATYEAIGAIYGVTKATAHKAITGGSWRRA